MYLIVGLGNPEPEYSNSRHNVGFDVVNLISKKNKVEVCKKKFDGLMALAEIAGEKVLYLKPQTYMNATGLSIKQAKKFYKIEDEKVIVIYDDVDIDVGNIRIRQQGSAGTHNGAKSVISWIGKNFIRIKVGVGKNDKDIADYVLEKMDNNTKQEIQKGLEKASLAIEEILKNGVVSAMNKYN